MFSDKSRVFHALRTDHNLTKLSRKDWWNMLMGCDSHVLRSKNDVTNKDRGTKDKIGGESSKISFKHQ